MGHPWFNKLPLGRKHHGELGAKTIWLGMQEIAVFVEGARYARQFNDG